MGTTREKLPDRRRRDCVHATIEGQTFYLEFGEYPDGRLGEVWLTAAKKGTFTRGILDALARVVSVALQCGLPVKELCKALRGLNFPPRGEVHSDSRAVVSCTSLADWIGREVALRYLCPAPAPDEVAASIAWAEKNAALLALAPASGGSYDPHGTEMAPAAPPRRYGGGGEVCVCGSHNLVRTGTCLTCLDCGSSVGGCS
jgi:ribonucleoside-diphosphate reductase alpha chain